MLYLVNGKTKTPQAKQSMSKTKSRHSVSLTETSPSNELDNKVASESPITKKLMYTEEAKTVGKRFTVQQLNKATWYQYLNNQQGEKEGQAANEYWSMSRNELRKKNNSQLNLHQEMPQKKVMIDLR